MKVSHTRFEHDVLKVSFNYDNLHGFNNSDRCFVIVNKKENENEKMKKKAEREEMNEEGHQLELKAGYEQDENYEESEE